MIRLNEKQFHNMVKECVRQFLKESNDMEDSYFGGGLPDNYNRENNVSADTHEKELIEIYNKILPDLNKIADILNDSEYSDYYDEIMDALNVLDKLPSVAKTFYTMNVY